jgi:hypothetical protein
MDAFLFWLWRPFGEFFGMIAIVLSIFAACFVVWCIAWAHDELMRQLKRLRNWLRAADAKD